MEEFVITIKNNLENKNNEVKNLSRYRTLLNVMIPLSSKINIIGIDEDGDVKFSVDLKDMGITFDLFIQYKNELFSDYMANVLGELFVRENMEEFSKMLTNSIKSDEYQQVVNTYSHYQFGMESVRNEMVFTFHISLLQNIIMESFKKKIK